MKNADALVLVPEERKAFERLVDEFLTSRRMFYESLRKLDEDVTNSAIQLRVWSVATLRGLWPQIRERAVASTAAQQEAFERTAEVLKVESRRANKSWKEPQVSH